jgi:hypothetical protein
MTYRVEFEGQALRQLKGIPPSVFDALVERVVDGYGLLSFRVDDATELISIFDLAWIG